ncbi:hypothetical protein [Paenibacillus tyrfis]|uniref:hypothetical protein n=1 Tax=Paenibacillus tyrfis TaxID=1501230 RepID=UPI002E153063
METIIEKHDGTITVHSEQGVGTTFEVSFPSQHKLPNGTERCKRAQTKWSPC